MKLKRREMPTNERIKYRTLLDMGVENTAENRARYLNGEALDLISELPNRKEQEDCLGFDKEWFKQKEEADQAYLESIKEQELDITIRHNGVDINGQG